MAPVPPSEPRFVVCDDTSISVEWDADVALSYHLQYKEYPQSWEEAHVVEAPKGQGKITTSVSHLQPCMTYNIRLVAVAEDGQESEPGPEIIIDTAAGSCTPKPRKNCCIC